MRRELLQLLACPGCGEDLACVASTTEGDDVIEGRLECRCARNFKISGGIPRFVPNANYGSSFGLQWNRFRREQLDSSNLTRNSRQRFETETQWSRPWMQGKRLLDAGCGSGRFLEIAAESGAEVVGVDISNAVNAARENLRHLRNVHLVQASVDNLPFRQGAFDGAYCLGVLQHAAEPAAVVAALARALKVEGKLAITAYERKPWTLLAGKYLIRPVTRRLPPRLLLGMVRVAMPVLFPLTEILFRLPLLKRGFMFLIPVSNYVGNPQLTLRQRYQWAVLDTFDALSPRYDRPLTEAEVDKALSTSGLTNIRRGQGMGLNLLAEKVQAEERAFAAVER